MPFLFLFVLVMISAALSPQPLLLSLLAFILFGVGYFASILDLSKVNNVKLKAVIFPDGQVRLERDGKIEIEGSLCTRQWCNHRLAVLRYIAAGKWQHLVFIAKDQNADEYRRLNVWLRQGFCNDT